MNDADLIWIPRVNTIEGMNQNHIQKWGWRVGNRDLVFNASVSRVGAEIKSNTGGVNIYVKILKIFQMLKNLR